MPLPYINTTPIHKNIKKSWWSLLRHALATWDFEGYLYIYQKSNDGSQQSINYQNCLRAVRAKNRPKFRPLSQSRWWLGHRLSCYKRGIRISLDEAINYE